VGQGAPARAKVESGGTEPTSAIPVHHPAGENEMQILILAICALAAIWVVVLLGSRFFGPR
jgi:hypothetical protein